MHPEEDEWLASLLLCDLLKALQILVSLVCAAIVNVGQESDYTDDMTCVLALVVVHFLSDQLVDLGLNVSFVEKFAHERCDAGSVTRALICLLLRVRFTFAILPIQDGWVALDLETLGKLSLRSCIDFCKLDPFRALKL